MSLVETLHGRYGAYLQKRQSDCLQPTVFADAAQLKAFMSALKNDPECDCSMLLDLFGIDTLTLPQEGRGARFQVVYNFFSLKKNHRLFVKVDAGDANPSLATVSDLWPAADWYEREVWDMFGIRFEGHPDLKRILLYDQFQGHPLRKDYPYNKRQPLIGPLN
jgi:NADH-quinone oxidoreductase subunit C